MPKSLSVKNIPNLCRKLAHRYMQAFYTDWVYKVFWHFLKMYPICVECLHIGICKHSTQIGYIRLTPIPFLHKLGTFSKMCPICVECLRINTYSVYTSVCNFHFFWKKTLFIKVFIVQSFESIFSSQQIRFDLLIESKILLHFLIIGQEYQIPIRILIIF